ncbi:MAG: ferredoxin family protein [Candidatus Baldrarchaeota archaeon]
MPIKKVKAIYIDEKLCKGCHICVDFCPQKVYVVSEKMNEKGVYPPIPLHIEKCTACKLCELYCPDFAIAVDVEEKEEKQSTQSKDVLTVTA